MNAREKGIENERMCEKMHAQLSKFENQNEQAIEAWATSEPICKAQFALHPLFR